MYKIAITGHANIESCFGVDIPDNGEIYDKEIYNKVYTEINETVEKIIAEKGEVCLISGMARGVDEIFADIAMNKNLPLIICVPYSVSWHKNRGHSRGFRPQAVKYDNILAYKNLIQINNIPKRYKGHVYMYANFARNKAMVDISDEILIYSLKESPGTDNCIKHILNAGRKHRYIRNFRNEGLLNG